MASLLYYHA
ncbi:hypothetical protein YPPY66_3128, partial [Yersinia pestis PY-66]